MPYLHRSHRSLPAAKHSSSKNLDRPYCAHRLNQIVKSSLTEKLIGGASFHCAQRVQFVGGLGIIRSYKPEAQSWSYLVEMELGPEPDFGRIGAEAMVIITEADLDAA
jgi:hypothetical protein